MPDLFLVPLRPRCRPPCALTWLAHVCSPALNQALCSACCPVFVSTTVAVTLRQMCALGGVCQSNSRSIAYVHSCRVGGLSASDAEAAAGRWT